MSTMLEAGQLRSLNSISWDRSLGGAFIVNRSVSGLFCVFFVAVFGFFLAHIAPVAHEDGEEVRLVFHSFEESGKVFRGAAGGYGCFEGANGCV